MRQAGVETWWDVASLEAVGVTEALPRLPELCRVRQKILGEVRRRSPSAAILIDYPGFNLHLAKHLCRLGLRVYYFIAPQLWAWGPWRARKLARRVDLLLVIFPFEVDFFRALGIEALFVGHPLVDRPPDPPPEEIRARLGLRDSGPVIALLPGSRRREVSVLLPIMAKAARILWEFWPGAQFLLPVAEVLEPEWVQGFLGGLPVRLARGTSQVLTVSDAAITASGTATLEAGLLGVPMVIVYKVNWLSAPVMRFFINCPSIGLVNLVAGERVVPELLQEEVTPANIVREVRRAVEDRNHRAWVKARLMKVRERLGEPGAFERAARAILSHLGS
jgi:lipid-A-disaccharide synthase